VARSDISGDTRNDPMKPAERSSRWVSSVYYAADVAGPWAEE
jgi:hypothetical protein